MDELKVFVTSIIDPSMFWARIGCDVELEGEQMLEQMISNYVSQVQGQNKSQDTTLAPNQIILAKSNEHGGRWLRATAVSCSSSQITSEIDVVFTGYGSNELVGWSDIIAAVPDSVCEWEKSAICFGLDGIEPVGDCWSNEAIDYFSNCVLKKRLSCKCVAGDRLLIYTSKGKPETIQDCLVRKGYAKCSSDEKIGVASSKMNGHPPMSTVAAEGGIPEFDTTHLFCPSDSPTLLPEEMQPETTDFEEELHKEHLDPSSVGIPTHSDYFYCGQRSANSPGRPEQYSKKARDIKEELERVSRSNRQIVRTEPAGWRAGSGRLWLNRPATDPRIGFKSSKIGNYEDDWRIPKSSRSLGSPYDESSKHTTYEPKSFKEDLQNLRKYLNDNSSQEVILAFLRQILIGDDACHQKLFSCLTAIVDETLAGDKLLVRSLDLLESLKSENNEFHQCLSTVITQCHTACIQVADFESLKLRITSFTELLAHLILRFPDESQIVNCALEIADVWIDSKIKLTDEEVIKKTIFATCLKNLVCILADDSVSLVRQNFFRLLNAVREILVSEVQPRSVREIWLDLLLYVERKETENRMLSSNTFGQIASHSHPKHNDSVDFNGVPNTVGLENPSCSQSAASPAFSSASHSSFQSAGAGSVKNYSHITPPASRSSPFDTNEASSLNESNQELLQQLPDQSESNPSEGRHSTRRASKKRGQKKMSLQSFNATLPSPVTLRKTPPSHAIFRGDVNCVTCGSQYHLTGDCPDRSSKFLL